MKKNTNKKGLMIKVGGAVLVFALLVAVGYSIKPANIDPWGCAKAGYTIDPWGKA